MCFLLCKTTLVKIEYYREKIVVFYKQAIALFLLRVST